MAEEGKNQKVHGKAKGEGALFRRDRKCVTGLGMVHEIRGRGKTKEKEDSFRRRVIPLKVRRVGKNRDPTKHQKLREPPAT